MKLQTKSAWAGILFIFAAFLFPGCNLHKEDIDSGLDKPNILLIFTDDQRFNTIHTLGNDEVITPNIDQLAERGVSFTHAHIMGGTSGAICMPSRAMLMTGKSLFHLEMKGAAIPDDHTMLPEILQQVGYKTFGTGKWHNGKHSYARCFTHGGKIFFGGMSNHLAVPYFDFDSTGNYPEENKKIGNKFSSELFVDEAIRFLEEEAGDDPFFMYVSFTAPHDPRMAPESFEKLYSRDEIKLPPNFMSEHPFPNGEMKVRDEKLAPWPRTPEIIKDHIASYYAMITHTDSQIGRLLKVLEKNGKKENTIIILAGDNGLAVGQHGLLGKQNLYEHSVRVPLIFAGPGIPENSGSDALCYLNDIFPTLCDLVKADVPEDIEGISLLPVLKNQESKIRSQLFFAYRNLQRGIRTEDNWKLIKYQVNNVETTQLFNLNDDPWEINSLAENPEYSEKIDELRKMLDQAMEKYDDPMDLNMKYWGKEEVFLPEKMVDHLAIGKRIRLHSHYSGKYTGGGDGALIDGVHGLIDIHDNAWQGYEKNDLDVTIDLGSDILVKRVSARFLQDAGAWVFLPGYVEIRVSEDGEHFTTVCKVEHDIKLRTDEKIIHDFVCKFDGTKNRYIRIFAKNIETCPDWHPGAGGKAWIFADEFIIE